MCELQCDHCDDEMENCENCLFSAEYYGDTKKKEECE